MHLVVPLNLLSILFLRATEFNVAQASVFVGLSDLVSVIGSATIALISGHFFVVLFCFADTFFFFVAGVNVWTRSVGRKSSTASRPITLASNFWI